MLLVSLLIIVLSILIFMQDILSRSVYWICFPVIGVCFILIHFLNNGDTTDYIKEVCLILGFLLLQFFLLFMFLSIKNRKIISLTDGLIGWGDILFLISLGFYFSFLNFLLFYITSLILVIAVWLIWQALNNKQCEHIPLAGLQALFFAMVFTYGWQSHPGLLMSDAWLFKTFKI